VTDRSPRRGQAGGARSGPALRARRRVL